MFWSCASGVTIWTFYEVIMMWAIVNGYIPALPNSSYLLWTIGIIFLIPIWETFYFYIIHRSLHWPPLYRFAHSLHHRNTNVGPWSGLSMHPFEHLVYLGSVLIHFVVPANPLLIIFHLQYFNLSTVTTHSGHEALTCGDKNVLPLGTYHHQLHHRYFDCNYGGLEIPWDKWFGSFHDGTTESHQLFLEKRKKVRIMSKLSIKEILDLKGVRQIAFVQVTSAEQAIATAAANMDMIGTAFRHDTASFSRLNPESHFQFGLPWGQHASVEETLRD